MKLTFGAPLTGRWRGIYNVPVGEGGHKTCGFGPPKICVHPKHVACANTSRHLTKPWRNHNLFGGQPACQKSPPRRALASPRKNLAWHLQRSSGRGWTQNVCSVSFQKFCVFPKLVACKHTTRHLTEPWRNHNLFDHKLFGEGTLVQPHVERW